MRDRHATGEKEARRYVFYREGMDLEMELKWKFKKLVEAIAVEM
jgi:hypothetical protein